MHMRDFYRTETLSITYTGSICVTIHGKLCIVQKGTRTSFVLNFTRTAQEPDGISSSVPFLTPLRELFLERVQHWIGRYVIRVLMSIRKDAANMTT